MRRRILQPARKVLRQYLSSSANPNRLLTFLTDVEGDASYLHRYVTNSRVLKFHDENTIEFTSPHAMLLYGGDIWDKGGSDLRVIRQLLDLKRRYPNRVHFVMGNRDINKMRMTQELSAACHGGVWWKNLETAHKVPMDPSWSITQRLKYILGHTMGCPNAFELRRKELQPLARNNVVSDEDVLQSYLDSCNAETGEISQYLRQSNICIQIGKLFVVHGALPWMVNTDPYELSLPWRGTINNQMEPAEWMKVLNNFAKHQLEQWRLSQHEPTDGVWATRGGFHYWPQGSEHSFAGLLQYGMGWLPNHERVPTVIYSSWTKSGMPHSFFTSSSREAEFTRKFMRDANIQLILSGHQPQGDFPTPIRLGSNKLIMACDTSYSGDTKWKNDIVCPPGGGRGRLTVCEVLVEQCTDTGDIVSVTSHGVLSNGRPFETTNMLNSDDPAGHLLRDGSDTTRPWWIKAEFVDGSRLISTAEGYDVVNSISSR